MVEHERTGPLDLLTWSFSRVAMWLPFFIVLIILYEVMMRYVFAAATLWVNEMSLWIGGAIFLSSGLYAMQQRSHIRIFILYDMAPLWLRRTFDALSVVCVCVFAFSVIWGGFGEALAKVLRWETFGTAYDPPLPATIKPLILVMMIFLALQSISNLIRDWPSAAWVRQVFDIVVTIVIFGLVIWGLMFIWGLPGDTAVPLKWRIAITIFLTISGALVVYGLFKDFNRTPQKHVEVDEIEEEAEFIRSQLEAPAQVLSGNPPKPGDTASQTSAGTGKAAQ